MRAAEGRSIRYPVSEHQLRAREQLIFSRCITWVPLPAFSPGRSAVPGLIQEARSLRGRFSPVSSQLSSSKQHSICRSQAAFLGQLNLSDNSNRPKPPSLKSPRRQSHVMTPSSSLLTMIRGDKEQEKQTALSSDNAMLPADLYKVHGIKSRPTLHWCPRCACCAWFVGKGRRIPWSNATLSFGVSSKRKTTKRTSPTNGVTSFLPALDHPPLDLARSAAPPSGARDLDPSRRALLKFMCTFPPPPTFLFPWLVPGGT